jgi:hypothetical protein
MSYPPKISFTISARSGKKAKLKESTLMDIAGLRPERPSRGQKAILLEFLTTCKKLGIILFKAETNRYNQIIYSIKLVAEKGTAKTETPPL